MIWALATGSSYRMPCNVPPCTVRGGNRSPGRALSCRPSITAPIRCRGVATRAMGRRDSEESPVRVETNGRPARSPQKRRIVVPEFPQSSAAEASCSPARPTPSTRASVPACWMGTPSARKAAIVLALSPPMPRPLISTGPSASAPNSRARCEMDLSPGTLTMPRSAGLRLTRSRCSDLGSFCFIGYFLRQLPRPCLLCWHDDAQSAAPPVPCGRRFPRADPRECSTLLPLGSRELRDERRRG